MLAATDVAVSTFTRKDTEDHAAESDGETTVACSSWNSQTSLEESDEEVMLKFETRPPSRIRFGAATILQYEVPPRDVGSPVKHAAAQNRLPDSLRAAQVFSRPAESPRRNRIRGEPFLDPAFEEIFNPAQKWMPEHPNYEVQLKMKTSPLWERRRQGKANKEARE
mmetsp:Transcript_71013/g.125821  ORF Transcript_71013/g.125821 Transcript_71013/m.125821 type:complete len:166 (-) Transcript_71013:88-585(-)